MPTCRHCRYHTPSAPLKPLTSPIVLPREQESIYSAPTGHTVHTVRVREVLASVVAGFIYPLLGVMRTMPDLGMTHPYMNIDVDENGKVVGIF